jgi:hypothetical protein
VWCESLDNENKEQRIENIKELETVVEIATGADVDINELKIPRIEKTELERIVEEKCTKVITTVICEGDIVGVNSGRYWVEGKVVRVSRFGISIQNPEKEFIVRLGKINMITIHQRGKIYKKYKDAINEFFKNT